MIHDPIVLDGTDVNAVWNECEHQADILVKSDGKDLRAAAGADPGIVSCPKCGAMHWHIGSHQKCSQCAFCYPTDWWPMLSWGQQAGARGHSVTTGLGAKRILHPVYHYAYLNHDTIDISFDGRDNRKLLPWDEIIKQPQSFHKGVESMKTVIVDVTRTVRYSVKITEKYKWAVDTGRFEGDLIAYAAHMGRANAPEATCIDYGGDTEKVQLVEIKQSEE